MTKPRGKMEGMGRVVEEFVDDAPPGRGWCDRCAARRSSLTRIGDLWLCKACRGQEAPVKRGGHPRFHELLEEMRRVHDMKNSDYAAVSNALSNFYECERAGISSVDGCFTRLSDKYCRLANLLKKARGGEGPAVKDESVRDTLVDLANYALLMVILLEEAGVHREAKAKASAEKKGLTA